MERSGEKWCMLIGHYFGRLGAKNRTAIPSRFRRELGKKVVVAQWYENCLAIVSFEQWEKIVNQIKNKTFLSSSLRDTDRFLLGNTYPVELDSQGRFVLPASLADYANLGEELVFVGLFDRLEVWDKNSWQEHQKYLKEHAGEIAEKLNQGSNQTSE